MIRPLMREAMLSAFANRLASVATLVLVAGMCATVLLTSGRAQGVQQGVLSTIDASGTRSITVLATPQAGLDSTVLDRLAPIRGIESAVALGSARDVKNSLLADGTAVPLRDYWGDALGVVNSQEAVASSEALRQLGMLAPVGSVSRPDGTDVAVVGLITDPSFLADYEPLLLTPRNHNDVGSVGAIVIITSDATMVEAVAAVITPLVAGTTPGQVSIHTSAALDTLRGSIDDQLGVFGSTLAAGVLTLCGLLVAAVQAALVLLRRKDFGRRRALGASRPLIAGLVVLQTTFAAGVGALLGATISLLVLTTLGDPYPSVKFTLAVIVVSIAVSLIAAMVPALIAAHRHPIKELRVA